MNNTEFPNFFKIFSLEENFDIDLQLLEKNYLELQMRHHPDVAISKEGGNLDFASYINLAYQTLKSDIKRAEYMLDVIYIYKKNDDLEEKTLESLLLSLQPIISKASILDDASNLVQNEIENEILSINVGFLKSNLDEVAASVIRYKFLNSFKCKLCS